MSESYDFATGAFLFQYFAPIAKATDVPIFSVYKFTIDKLRNLKLREERNLFIDKLAHSQTDILAN